MKVFAVSGLHGTGKTTVVEHLVKELASRGLQVATVKDIHYEGFAIDKEGTNTWRHRQAGAGTVVARGMSETDFLHAGRMPMQDIIGRLEADVVVIEGAHDEPYPRITCAATAGEADERTDDLTFAYSGKLSNSMRIYRGIKVFDVATEAKELADLALSSAKEHMREGGRP